MGGRLARIGEKCSCAGLKLAYLYAIVPIAVFVIGWLRWYIAVPTLIILIYCFCSMCRHLPEIWKPELTRENIQKCILIAGIVFLWVYFSGVGTFVFQNSDHAYRNAVFEALVEQPWPVVQTMTIDGVESTRGLIYYIGFWLPSAVIGKIFGIQVGYCFQALWAAIGIFLFYYLICTIQKKIVVWPLIVFILFSGLDAVGYFITRADMLSWSNTLHLEWWSGFQFSSFTTQLFWVFNQAVPAWLIFMLLIIQQRNRYILLLISLSMLTSTLPFIGMLPFALYFILERKYNSPTRKGRIRELIKDTFGPENVLGGGIIGIISCLYLIGNSSGKILGTGTVSGGKRGYLMLYLIFIILEVIVYFLSTYKYQKGNKLFFLTLGWLCVCPIFTVGFGKDFCMRASIPALLILYLMVIDTIKSAYGKRDYLILLSLITLLLIGSITPIHEINRTVVETAQRYREKRNIIDNTITDYDLLNSSNFAGNIEKSFFFKNLCRK